MNGNLQRGTLYLEQEIDPLDLTNKQNKRERDI